MENTGAATLSDSDDAICRLCLKRDHCVDLNDFSENFADDILAKCIPEVYNGEYFQQHEGTTMSNFLSPSIANLFMSKFETQARDKFDDILAVFDTKEISLEPGTIKTCYLLNVNRTFH
ncbi:hypothetical protein NQ318_010690 [Aromia moschata]|uniref:Uncharacterized protein n=1 Tax=Aromia moschata TaxID=1265417 RepID=A0AAV8XMC0_9CUCU|nr:hypothetical protein NQ318_010690 [Aromia moschata]